MFSYHDAEGRLGKLLKMITPELKKVFDKAFVSVTPSAEERGLDKDLLKDDFFVLNYNSKEDQIGDHYMNGIRSVSKSMKGEDIIHIGCLDRLAFGFLNYSNEITSDLKAEKQLAAPILYTRSRKAWQTHPRNYWAIESMGTEVCERLYGLNLDLFWCDYALKNNDLKQIIPKVKTHDLRILIELIWSVKDKLKVEEVDWLSWEDPFIFEKNEKDYKKEREQGEDEKKKRLGYVIPAIEMVLDNYKTGK
jgi:hypothetical protein